MNVIVYLATMVVFWMSLWAVTRRLLNPPANAWLKWLRWIALFILPILYFLARGMHAVIWSFMGVSTRVFWLEGITLVVAILAWFFIQKKINNPRTLIGAWPTQNYVGVMVLLLLFLPFAGHLMNLSAGAVAYRVNMSTRRGMREYMFRPVEPKDNAYDLYLHLAVGFKSANPENDPVELIDAGVNNPAFLAAVVRVQPEADIARQAAARIDCVVDVPPITAMEMLSMPVTNGFRHGANLLSVSARWKASNGDVDGAIDDLMLIYPTAGHAVRTIPGTLGYLIYMGVHARADQTCIDILPAVTSTTQLDRIKLPQTDFKADLIPKIEQEGMLANSQCAQLLVTDPSTMNQKEFGALAESIKSIVPGKSSFRQALGLFVWREEAITANADFFHAYIQSAIESAELGPGQVTPARQAILDDLKAHPFSLVKIVLANMDSVMQLRFVAQAKQDGAVIAIAATRYRLEHGSYPDAAAKLVPAYLKQWPADPYDNQPMRMKLQSDGSLLIYSVGVDLKDDGGNVVQNGKSFKSAPDTGYAMLMPKAQ